jgi:hypothetical protein
MAYARALEQLPFWRGFIWRKARYTYTGTNGANLDSQQYFRGTLVGLSGISLQRDLVDDSVSPAEFFEYAPDQIIFLLNSGLEVRKMSWKEVAP